jgi:hypothetical protein
LGIEHVSAVAGSVHHNLDCHENPPMPRPRLQPQRAYRHFIPVIAKNKSVHAARPPTPDSFLVAFFVDEIGEGAGQLGHRAVLDVTLKADLMASQNSETI